MPEREMRTDVAKRSFAQWNLTFAASLWMQSEVQNLVLSEDEAHRGHIDDRSAPLSPSSPRLRCAASRILKAHLRTHCALDDVSHLSS